MSGKYENRLEYMKDYEAICAIYLQEYMEAVVSKRQVTDSVYEKYKGLVISYEEADEAYREKETFRPSKQATDKIIEQYGNITKKVRQSKIFLPLEYLSDIFKLQPIEKIIIVAAYLPLFYNSYEKTYGYINDNVNQRFLRLSTAIEIFAESDRQLEQLFYQKETKYFFEQEKENVSNKILKPSKRMAEILCFGRLMPDYRWCNIYYPSMKLDTLIGNEAAVQEVFHIMENGENRVVCMEGDDGTGKKSIIKKAAEKRIQPVLFVDFEQFLEEAETKSLEEGIKSIVEELLIQQSYLCIYHIDFEKKQRQLLRVLREAHKIVSVLFVCMEEKQLLDTGNMLPCYYIRVERPARMERSKLWDSFEHPLESGIILQEYANKYNFTPKEIKQIVQYTDSIAKLKDSDRITKEYLDESCSVMLSNAFQGKAEPVVQKFTLKDLILPEEQKNQIREGLNHIIYRNVVYDEWGFEEKLAYGKGLTMLFAGPPGTGKTMAAGIVGKELGLPVYKADLSRMVSKYIGDTEKSLSELFEIAERNNSILFFDEMDSLFGKRSEVKDSHDKYANLETSYLLQKLEDYEGIVLMATNFQQNIDEAFLRRINYIIQFPMPNSSMREELWRSMFTKKMPVEDTIDFKYLAEQFELSGAAIKSIVMSAAFIAAERKERIGMYQILRAVKKLLTKQGKIMLDGDFGQYSFYLKK